LTGLAHVAPATGDDHLRDRCAAADTRLAGAVVDEEAVLKGAAHAVQVAEVVDARAACVDALLERLDDRLAQASALFAR
jgi:hypothetical protein